MIIQIKIEQEHLSAFKLTRVHQEYLLDVLLVSRGAWESLTFVKLCIYYFFWVNCK